MSSGGRIRSSPAASRASDLRRTASSKAASGRGVRRCASSIRAASSAGYASSRQWRSPSAGSTTYHHSTTEEVVRP
jgi:hypothetical protein